MNAIDAKTIVVIGNGKSISNINWPVLDCVDTIGINGSFKLWNDIRWYPTYHYFGRKHDEAWHDGIKKFINENECKKIFYSFANYHWMHEYGNMMQSIKTIEYPRVSPNPEKWENPFLHDVNIAIGMIARTKGFEVAQKMVAEMPDDIDNNLNVYGIFKVLMKIPQNIRECDYIKKPRFVKEFFLPSSFDGFYEYGGMSGETACIIAYLLGYKKIILLGCDNNFVVNKDGTMRQKSTYGIKDMFYGHKYNTKEDIPCPVCRTTDGLRKSMIDWWKHLKGLIEIWNLPIEVVNCCRQDGLAGIFPTKTPENLFGNSICS